MGFILEEWVEKTKNTRKMYEYHTYPVFAGPFKTREEANDAIKLHQPHHGGFITVVPEPQENPTPMRKRPKKKRGLRETKRPTGRGR